MLCDQFQINRKLYAYNALNLHTGIRLPIYVVSSFSSVARYGCLTIEHCLRFFFSFMFDIGT